MRSVVLLFASSLVFFSGCQLLPWKSAPEEEIVYLDTLEVVVEPKPPYRPSRTLKVDLMHTKLDVRFDWDKQYLYGKAWLTLKPYFYSVETIVLDAKGFDINEVSLVDTNEVRTELEFDYDGLQVTAQLPRTYTRQDTLMLFIEYTSKPNELKLEGGSAITDAKGLYFINPEGENPNKPLQIWTQGEPESNSAWFPTVDSPNEKTTQEIFITVEDKYVTLSNGRKVYSINHEDGTRTDYWKQDLPHTPYLFMMAIGEYAVVSDTLYDTLSIDYYVEPAYEPYARDIFGKTPEMIEFFSEQLDYPFPWDKYAQVVVRDYVSGAMENTSAVIFGEFAQKTRRELLDESPEDVVSHELYHHWFGDITTCESWANLPLNESFATYGEYLWREHAYGLDMADKHLHADLRSYLNEFRSGKSVHMIRYHHDKPDDMFDSHSYAKGGRILHMLRHYVGDEAFFASLNRYLHDRAYQPAEIHHLRLAFEEVTGEDMNWFFDQWFLDNGHPKLEIDYSYNDSLRAQFVTIRQIQDPEEYPVYRLPMAVDIYASGDVTRHEITVDSLSNTFVFDVSEKPDLVNVDANKMLLCEKDDFKSIEAFVFQYRNAPRYLDKLEALEACATYARKNEEAGAVLVDALDAPFWGVRVETLKKLKKLRYWNSEVTLPKVEALAQNDPKSTVRAEALSLLTSMTETPEEYTELMLEATKDSSYYVIIEALNSLRNIDDSLAVVKAKELRNETNTGLRLTCASILASTGDPEYFPFFLSLDREISGFGRMGYLGALNDYVMEAENDSLFDQTVPLLEHEAGGSGAWFIRYYAYEGLARIRDHYQAIQDDETLGETERNAAAEKVTDLQQRLEALLEQESNGQLKRFLE